ncbi:TonB-dependent receptor plug domain-containing protein [Anaeromyxobacter paludicola]|uniref:TonB-dependent receptor n=1 Tax=Anaeromyxobacter paludicola TaxID=2918171 RepID=A0ABN6N128_9BACT|nr:TonB-dependent receptor [Anaeromyxobacter paludicola]BDG06920.1 hypothetical protein AMPC_00330 [Anaeromyxobacter paludicola]
MMKTIAAALSAALLLPSPAPAQDVSDLEGLLNQSVVSTASKSAETADLAPATTSVITAEDLRRYGFTSLDQAINFLAVGMVTEPSYGTPEIGARGVLLSGDYGNHVLLLVDGHAVNEPWDGTAYFDRSAAIPIDLVDHVEIILGPGSVLYGSSAMLGVINVITRRAKDYQGMHLVAEGGAPLTAHVAGGYGQTFEVGGREGELTIGLDYQRDQGPTLSYAPQAYADGTPWGGDASHRAIDVPAGQARLVLGDLDVTLRGAVSRRTATQLFSGSFDDSDSWERDRWLSLDARWARAVSPNLQLSGRLYGDLYDYFANIPSGSALDCLEGQASCVYQNSGVSRWGGLEVSGTWDWLQDGRYVTLVGADGRLRHVTSWLAYQDRGTGSSTRTSAYDVSDTVIGAYLQQTLRPASWLSLNAGLRLDDYENFGAHLSPRLAAVVPAWSGGTVKAIYSEAFRAPSFYERYYADATTELAAPSLRPETVRSVEGLLEQRLGAQRFRFGLFRSWWNDMVVLVPASDAAVAAAIASGALAAGAANVTTYANASRVDSYGLNADWEGSGLRQRLRYGVALTVAHSRASGDAPLAAAAQVFGNARVSYDLGGPVLALAVRAAGPRPVSGSSLDPAPDAKAQCDLHAAVSGPLGAGIAYRLSADYSVLESSAYAVGPGRDQLLPLPRYQLMAGLRFDR